MTPEDIKRVVDEINRSKEPRIPMPVLTMAHLKWIAPILISVGSMGVSGYTQMGSVATDGVITVKVRPELRRINDKVNSVAARIDGLEDVSDETNHAIVRIDNDMGAMRDDVKIVRSDVRDIRDSIQKLQDPRRR